MAFIRGNINQNLIENFNPIRDDNIDHEFFDNIRFSEGGFVFEDVLSLFNDDGAFYRLDFGGRSVGYTRGFDDSPIITSGFFTGLKESVLVGSTWVETFAAAGFSFGANEFYRAVMSPTQSDDISVVQKILSGNDIFELSNSDDLVRAYAGNDRMLGFGGNDRLDGGTGNDSIDGGTGNDKITGGIGKDILSGNAGVDQFIYRSISDSGTGLSKADQIRDFQGFLGEKIDLSAIDAYTTRIGNQSFTYIGSKGFSGARGEVRFSNGLLQANIGTDRRSDFEIVLTGVTSFSSSMLVL